VGRCKFCSEAVQWEHTWRGHGAKYMVDTLEVLSKKYGKHIFYIGDNDFLHDPARTKAFIALMRKRRPEVKMWIQTTCGNFVKNEKLLRDLKEVGVYQVMLGIEAAVPDVLRRLNKPQNMELVKKAVELGKTHEFIVMGMLMWGAPWDTKAGLHKTLDFLVKNCDIVGPNAVSPWPGTPYYKECEAAGAIEIRDLSKFNMLDCVTRTAELSAPEADLYYKTVVGRALLLNWKALGNFFFSNKFMIRHYYKCFAKMGRSFLTGNPWRQQNYQPFEDFLRDRRGGRSKTRAGAGRKT